MSERNARNHQVVWTNGRAERCEFGAAPATMLRRRIIEGKRLEACAQVSDELMIGGSASGLAPLGPVNQLAKNDRAEDYVSRFALLRARDESRVALAEIHRPRVRVEQICQGKGSRSSNSPCCGRSKSPCQAPAVVRTHARHSAHCSSFIGAGSPSGSKVTRNSRFASAGPSGTTTDRTPSAPTRDVMVVGTMNFTLKKSFGSSAERQSNSSSHTRSSLSYSLARSPMTRLRWKSARPSGPVLASSALP